MPRVAPFRVVALSLTALLAARVAEAVQPFEPPPELRSAVLQACRERVLREARDDGRRDGFGHDAEVVLAADGVAFAQEKKDRIRVEGRGEVRLGPDYLLQPMTFTCEWDTKDNRLRKGGYRLVKGADVTALPPGKAAAVSACKREVRSELEEMARRRGYWNPTLTVRPGVTFTEGDGDVTLEGTATYKLDHVQEKEVEREYRCVWDPERGRLLDVDARGPYMWNREIGTVTCESRDMKRKTCSAPIGRFVRVRHNRSDTRCAQGFNWDYSSREIVVWDGCRATFEFEMR